MLRADTSDPGAGPRHFAWHPNGHWCYLINEIGATIHALDYATASGALRRICSVSTLPAEAPAGAIGSTAHVLCSPCGRFVYGSNRPSPEGEGWGDNTVAVYSVDQEVSNSQTIVLTLDGLLLRPSGWLTWLPAAAERRAEPGAARAVARPQPAQLRPLAVRPVDAAGERAQRHGAGDGD